MARFNKNNYRKQLREEDKRYAALRKEQQREEKRKLKKQRNIFLKIKEAQKKNEEEQEAIEKEKESRRERFENFGKKSLSNANKLKKKFKKNIKRARRGKVAKIISRFFIPGMLINSFFLLTFFVMFEVYAGGIVGTIAGLANPQQRAILQAKGIIGDKDVTNIPSYLIGDEPDLKGSNGSLNDSSSTSGAGEAGNKIGDNDPAEEVFVKVARVVGEAVGVQPRLVFGQMCVEVGGPKFSSQAKEDKNLSGITYPGGQKYGATRGQVRGAGGCEGGVYSKFPTWEAYEKTYEDTLNADFKNGKPQNAQQYAQILADEHYYAGNHPVNGKAGPQDVANYAAGIEQYAKQFDELNKKYPETKGSSNGGNNKSNNNNNNSSGGDSINSLPDAAKWIFQRESSMNIHATNGKYYGLGQLDKDYYQQLCGKPWNETNEADQVKAATAYMKQRYNTWDKAKAFWQANGWW